MTLMPELDKEHDSVGSISLACGTDNQGNMFLMDKLLTTKFPLGVVLMELATQLARRGATLRANWIPRDQNEEADALTNWDFRHFDSSRRVEEDLERLQFNVMKDLFAAGDDYLAELDALKLKAKSSPASAPAAGEKTRKRKDPPLRETNPW